MLGVRRTVAGVTAVLMLSACSGGMDSNLGSDPSVGTAVPTAALPTATVPPTAPDLLDLFPGRADALPDVVAWQPAATEIQPEIKLAAARVIEALGNASTTASTPQERLAAMGADPALVAGAGALVPPSAPSVAEVVYPQYGGLTPDASTVMTVVRQTWLAAGAAMSRTITVDVRLARDSDGWRVTALFPVEPVDRSTLDLTAPAAALADDPQVDLPPAAVFDLAVGVDPRVVDVLARLSRTYALSVSVVRAGHPVEIFGTDRPSKHTSGRAVDVWAIDGVPVVTMGIDDPLLVGFLDAARELGAQSIGGPVDLDGPRGVHFADDLHRDHVHIAFDEPAMPRP
jgi:hypothetical protein